MTEQFQRMLGLRVRAAREARDMTQEDLSALMGFNDRQSLSAIEQGLRAVKSGELIKLCEALSQNIDYFTDPFQISGEARYCWRTCDFGVDLARLETKVAPILGLVRWLCKSQASVLKRSLRLNLKSSPEEAQSVGQDLAETLKFRGATERGLCRLIESGLDMQVIYLDLPKAVTGVTCVLPDQTIIVVNRKLASAQRVQDLAVGVCYALCFDSFDPPREIWIAPDGYAAGKAEKLALKFALGLLVPAQILASLIEAKPSLEQIVSTAGALHIPSTLLMLEVPGYVKELRKKKSKVSKELESITPAPLPLDEDPAHRRPYSLNVIERLRSSIEDGRLSASKAWKLLSLSHQGLQDLFDAYGLGGLSF